MACFVSFLCCSFSNLTSSPSIINKDLQARRTDSCRLLLSSSTCLNRFHFLAIKSCVEERLSMKRRHKPVVFLDYKIVCTPSVISGFWVGPDIEDGWGFVEATLVNQMFEV